MFLHMKPKFSYLKSPGSSQLSVKSDLYRQGKIFLHNESEIQYMTKFALK